MLDAATSNIVTTMTCRRPRRSASRPNTSPPTGRMKNPTANTSIAESTADTLSAAWKNSPAKYVVKIAKTLQSYHSSALPMLIAAMTRCFVDLRAERISRELSADAVTLLPMVKLLLSATEVRGRRAFRGVERRRTVRPQCQIRIVTGEVDTSYSGITTQPYDTSAPAATMYTSVSL